MKQSEGNALVFNQRKVKNGGKDRHTRTRRKITLGKRLGDLIREKNKACGQKEESPPPQVRRFFFSSSAWHLMQYRA